MHCYLVLEILSLCLVQYSKPSKRKLSMYEYVKHLYTQVRMAFVSWRALHVPKLNEARKAFASIYPF